MIDAKRFVLGLNRYYRSHFQNTLNIKTFVGYAVEYVVGLLPLEKLFLIDLQHAFFSGQV